MRCHISGSKKIEWCKAARVNIDRNWCVPMSVFWLVIQFFLLSIMDIASFGRLIEFIFYSWSCNAFIQLVNRMRRSGDGGGGWLDGTNFNKTRLDHFFLLLGAFELLALINYTFWARRYARKLRRISTVKTHEDDTRN
jgi:peptide/histidine transporter 3/4